MAINAGNGHDGADQNVDCCLDVKVFGRLSLMLT